MQELIELLAASQFGSEDPSGVVALFFLKTNARLYRLEAPLGGPASSLEVAFSGTSFSNHNIMMSREGANREKLTVKKIINNEMFFHRLCPFINREKLCVNREKIGTKNPPFFSPLVFHRLRPHECPPPPISWPIWKSNESIKRILWCLSARTEGSSNSHSTGQKQTCQAT